MVVEATLGSYDVPGEWRAGLILPQLAERARGLLSRLTAQERRNYEWLKSAVLEGLRLPAAKYRRLFTTWRRDRDETWIQFATRLDNYLTYYSESYKVTTIEQLKQLTVTDRLRDSLSTEARAFVIRNERAGRLSSPKELADFAESFDESVKVTEGTGGSAANRAKKRAFVSTHRSLRAKGVGRQTESVLFAAPHCISPVSAQITQHYRKGQRT